MTTTHDDYDAALDSIGSYYAAIAAKQQRGDAAPLDYAIDEDEPYDRCPLCTSTIMAVCFAMVIGGLVFATLAVKEVMRWVM